MGKKVESTKSKVQRSLSRRTFVKSALAGAVVSSVKLGGFPTIVPASVLGELAPSKQINVGAIGNGRISRGHGTGRLCLPQLCLE